MVREIYGMALFDIHKICNHFKSFQSSPAMVNHNVSTHSKKLHLKMISRNKKENDAITG